MGEGVKGKNENLLTHARARGVIHSGARVVF